MSTGGSVLRAAIALVALGVSVPLAGASRAASAAPATAFISTVPAIGGVHLDVAGTSVVTAADGTASLPLATTTGIADRVHLGERAVGSTMTVAISKVVRLPGAVRGIRLQVGLDITSRVRLGIDTGTTGVSPSMLRRVRLHSVVGEKLDVDPRTTRNVWLLSRRTRLVADVLEPQHVTWSVDLVSAGPGLAMTTAMPRFDPFGHRAWPLRLATVHGTVRIMTVPRTPGVSFLIEGAAVVTDSRGTATAPVSDLNNVRDRLRLAGPDAGAVQVSNLRVTKLPPKVIHQRRLVAALDIRRPVQLGFVDLRGQPVPPSHVNRVRMNVGSAALVMTGLEARSPALLLVRVATKARSGWVARPVSYVLRSVLVDHSEAVFDGRQRFVADGRARWNIQLAVFRLRISVNDAILGSRIGSRAVITRPDGSHYDIRLGGRGAAVVPTLVRGLYGLRIDSAVVGGNTNLLVSRDDTVHLRVITLLDAILIAAVAMFLLLAVLSGGRLMARRRRAAAGVSR